jgi:eukaryotic-like serine/threonine-protein kinase
MGKQNGEAVHSPRIRKGNQCDCAAQATIINEGEFTFPRHKYVSRQRRITLSFVLFTLFLRIGYLNAFHPVTDPLNLEMVLLNAAIELPPSERVAYLERACAGQAELLQRLRGLLSAHDAAGDFLTESAVEMPLGSTSGRDAFFTRSFEAEAASSPDKSSDQIGRYKLIRQIGEGGCGTVYLAEQETPVRRRVAVKVIKLGMDTKNVIARFEAERQALALMDHPHIAKVLDAGATENGRPFFVMELVEGLRITEFCDRFFLNTQARLELFVLVCHAIQHAHQKGVIHRDIKPSNILVTWRDEAAMPIVIDFGIAKAIEQKLTDKTAFTVFQQFIGTPAYVSPEQASGNDLGIDTRSDIYSLGVLLYELLTGQTPFDTKGSKPGGLDELRKVICEKEPLRPSTRLRVLLADELSQVALQRQAEPIRLLRAIRGDLDWIVMKALEKDRNRRYETPAGLASDLQRHLNNEPVLARPSSNLYRAQKLIRRHRLATFATAAVLISLIVGLTASNYFYFQERSVLHDALLAEAHARRISGQTGQRFESLRVLQEAAAIRRDPEVRDEAIAALALTDRQLFRQKKFSKTIVYGTICFDVPVEKYAIIEEDGKVAIRSADDDHEITKLNAPGFKPVNLQGFSYDSRYLRIRYLDSNNQSSDWVWDVKTQIPMLKALPGSLADSFSSDNRLFGKNNPDGTFSIYNLDSGREQKHLDLGRTYNLAMFNPDNTRLAGIRNGIPRVEIRDTTSGSNLLTLACSAPVSALAWSYDGKQLAVACEDYHIYIWDTQTWTPPVVLAGHVARIIKLAFNHAGDLLASASWDGTTRLWEIVAGRSIANFPGGNDSLEFTADDRYLGPWSEANRVGLLEVAHDGEYRRLNNPGADSDDVSGPNFSADGRMVVAGTEHQICFWDARSGKKIGSIPARICWSELFHPDGRRLFLCDRQSGVMVQSLATTNLANSMICRLGPPQLLFAGEGFRMADLSRDGRHLAVAHFEGAEGFVFDLQNPAAKVVLSGHPMMDYIALSPDSCWAATGSWQNSLVKIWDARTGSCLRTLHMPDRTRVLFSPDGQWLATETSEYQLWKTGTWEPKNPPIPGDPIPEWNALAFSSDGRVMAITWERNKIQLRETASGRVLATLESPDPIILIDLHFSPDDTQLAARRMDQRVDLWDLRLIRKELATMKLDWEQPSYPPVGSGEIYKPVTLEIESGGATGGAPQ